MLHSCPGEWCSMAGRLVKVHNSWSAGRSPAGRRPVAGPSPPAPDGP
ncbi:hypothetical protein DVS28_a3410 [Euzebya pacifica]|uniref:Uncharacterized protein n=1 Tax=Euzebya pacifica TaxID=1608957 RepID=A0A346Y0T8_9ACTN|nr:hypothetical protein DVS28_a3410 [Euzebya pacifica]